MQPFLVPVTRWGTDGWAAISCSCPLWLSDGTGPSCVSSSGDTLCSSFFGMKELAGHSYTVCGHPNAGDHQPASLRHDIAAEVLDRVAAEYADTPEVIGFRVFGSTQPYEDHWNTDPRAPLRWRSGEWRLFAGDDGFEPIFRKDHRMREPIVKFYKSFEKAGNGAFATSTTATDADEFLRQCAMEMEPLVADRLGDLQFTFEALLPQICELWAKLHGYKADGVYEKRYLVAGTPDPEAHMQCVNVSVDAMSTPVGTLAGS